MALFSIITVCYNTEKEIKKTIESVLKQTCSNYEYYIIDGASTDRTKDIADSYRSRFAEKKIRYMVVSEKDTGLYNAMNKGTDLAKGKWLLFLNAGDYLCHNTILEKAGLYDRDDVGIMYGQAFYELYDIYKYIDNSPLDEIRRKMVFSHQCAFIKRNVMMKYKYDERYRIAADYDFFLKCYTNEEAISRIPLPVSVFTLGGVSSQKIFLQKKEVLDIHLQYGSISKKQYSDEIEKLEKNKRKYEIEEKIKKYIPEVILRRIRKKRHGQGYSTDLNKLIKEYVV